MSKEKQIDIIRDLLIEFDEMGFIPTTTVPDPEAYAIKWRAEITKAFEDYRKQSEGEWVLTGTFKSTFPLPVVNLHKACSVCKWSPPKYSDDYKEYKFCPNCGAKMKGGAE